MVTVLDQHDALICGPRGEGQTLPLTDLEIAIASHTNAAELWTRDQHFHWIGPLLDGLSIRFLD